MKSKIWLSSPHIGTQEQQFVQEAFDTNWVAPLGPNVDGFEQDISQFLGQGNVAALSSGTSALHLSLILAGVQPGDEVICQSMTFSASANPIAYQQATPIFVDSEEETWNIDPNLLEDAIKDRIAKGKKPKAIIPVHLYGMPAKMNDIIAVAEKYEIPILEDAAEALGSHINGKMCGTFGTMATLSFNGNKIITTSGGGALVCENENDAAQARFLATQARDNAPHYQHSHIGYNYRLSNILAGVGRGQMLVLQDRINARRNIFEQYKNLFSDIEGCTLPDEPKGYFSNRWLTTILVNPQKTNGITREDLRLALLAENIESRPLWKPMHQQPVFQDAPYYGNSVSEKLFENGLCLPSGSNLTNEELERVFNSIRTVFRASK